MIQIIVLLFMLFISPCYAADDWQTTLEGSFDIVDTFNEHDDWHGENSGDITRNTHPSDMPTINTGSQSIWDYYSYWKTSNGNCSARDGNSPDWIKDWGSGLKVGDSGKSAKINIHDGEASDLALDCDAPSRLGLYFVNGNGTINTGTQSDGYDEIYIFWRMRVAKAKWPTIRTIYSAGTCTETSCTADSGCCGDFTEAGYTSNGNMYTWWGSWKLASLSAGFTSVRTHPDVPSPTSYSPYGVHPNVPHIRPNSEANSHPFSYLSSKDYYRPTGIWEDVNNYVDLTAGDQTSADIFPVDEWAGIEIHGKINNPGDADSIWEMWFYDSDGNVEKVMEITDAELVDLDSSGHKFNKFFIGGNTSKSYLPDSNISQAYYVDDFIIDSDRIGPTYFELLSGSSTPNQGCSFSGANFY